MATSLPPPPNVLRSQHKLDTGRGDEGKGVLDSTRDAGDAFGSGGGEWQAVDYWYNRVLDKSSPSANTANPSALGLIAFGYTTALLQGANTTWTEESTEYVTIGFALFFGGLVQLLAGMWEFRRNNMFAATALSSYGGFWLSYGIYLTLHSGGVIPETGPHGLQMTFSLWGILTFFFCLCAIGLNLALTTLFFWLAALFFLLAGAQNGNVSCQKTAGWVGVFVAAVAWYIAFAELLNETWFRGRTVVPLGTMTWPNKLHNKKHAAGAK